ncbi:hypothetical protein AR457_06185 [Streptomyces agglomeratus]|uniref:Uncharacterized protein n=1 Tax=Streptomyces agglomeratus TaxID=285458 RepID=A0A1E5P3H9_9ACTN|nr:DUF5819 family protein [Streptomyces agglomeratus]OEJ24118.1 hypothetical protein AS594_06110 [Streptomyces agglomeratus]OEJ41878.1 hypothetical protein BGK70_30460 [Streptomyces agglomeratus]OEJ43744.1 hypothetical protein AR457_06185 [Streptomyces agglomeratus]OEJ54370.1 hypothetical protein BGK72_29780 [Streptomyces agglomeratus]OEJ56222.1 hypothetical protein BGM19_39290 [Streptomyces agglomeratus]
MAESVIPPPDPLAPRGTPLGASRRGIVRWFAAFVAFVALVHSSMLLLYVATDFPLSRAYSQQVNGWMRPLFPQDWSIFAPEPSKYNQHLEVRANDDGEFGPWIDLTAHDNAAYRGELLPSIEDQLVLRRAVSQYRTNAARANADRATGRSARYLLNVVLVRLDDMGEEPGQAVQLRLKSTRIPPPGTPGDAADTRPRYETLGYWKVRP